MKDQRGRERQIDETKREKQIERGGTEEGEGGEKRELIPPNFRGMIWKMLKRNVFEKRVESWRIWGKKRILEKKDTFWRQKKTGYYQGWRVFGCM